MNIWISILAAIVGYSLGAISFARIVGGRLFPGEDLTSTEVDIKGRDKKFLLRSVSASAIMIRSSPRYGCITGSFDMLKAALPTLVFRLMFPEDNYFLVVAAASVAGHNFPIFYGFKGGRGMSPLFGSLLVIDWLSVPVTNLIGMVLGALVFRDMLVAYTGGTLLLMPWFWFRFSDHAYFTFAVAINVFIWVALLPELREYVNMRRSGDYQKPDRLRDELDQGYIGLLFDKVRERGWIKDEGKNLNNTG